MWSGDISAAIAALQGWGAIDRNLCITEREREEYNRLPDDVRRLIDKLSSTAASILSEVEDPRLLGCICRVVREVCVRPDVAGVC